MSEAAFLIRERLGLSQEHFEQLVTMVTKHYLAWESPIMQLQHSLENVEKAVWVEEEQCLHCHYYPVEYKGRRVEAVWYHYDPKQGTWW